MATFSFGTGVTPGAPGTYINERVGNVASAGIASFNTTYLLVETDEDVPVTRFPFNSPVPVTSLADYKVLVGGVPTAKMARLSYNCVNSFFLNAQIGDLRVVRVGTPNQIVEIELLPSGTKVSSSGLPSSLQAGDIVYAQILLNGLKLVAGDGSTGYTEDGEWLGVPVTIPVDYISGDEVNNRKISSAIAAAIASAIESNPSVRSAIYVRDFGMVNDLIPSSNSENSYVTIAATTYDGNVSVVTEQLPIGAASVLMQNVYDVTNIVGLQNNLERVPQDYIQCISTAFDGQADQGYLLAPTAFAQFDADGRSAVGAAAANHCQDNNFKWMALADAGSFLVTDINKYKEYTPHQPAANLVTGNQYLVDNAIYKWTGNNVAYDRLRYQTLVPGYDPKVAVEESVETVAIDEKVGLLDSATFVVNSSTSAEVGAFVLDPTTVWPVNYQIQQVTLSDLGADFLPLLPIGETSANVYIVAPPFDSAVYGPYPSGGNVDPQVVFIAETSSDAVSILTEVIALGGTSFVTSPPAGCFYVDVPTGSTASATYEVAAWDLPVEINGQTSNLVQNISGAPASVNTLHLPGSLQKSTEDYRLSFISRTFFNPASLGLILTLDSSGLSPGSDYVEGVYSAVPLIYDGAPGDGSGATATITVDSLGEVSSVVLELSGTGYSTGDTLTADDADLGNSGIGSGFTIDVLTVTDSLYSNTATSYSGAATFFCKNHSLVNGQKVFFTQPILNNTTALFKGTSSSATNAYFVKVIDNSNFILATSSSNYLAGSFVPYPGLPTISTNPTILYTALRGGLATALNLSELTTFPFIRGRKYGFATGTVIDQACSNSLVSNNGNNPDVSILLNTSSIVTGNERVFPYGETPSAGWLPELDLVSPGGNTNVIANYICTPTVNQSFASEAYFVPTIDAIYGGEFDAGATSSTGPVDTFGAITGGTLYGNGSYTNVPLTGGSGTGATADITVVGGIVTAVSLNEPGLGYSATDDLSASSANLGGSGSGFEVVVGTITTSSGELTDVSAYAEACGLANGNGSLEIQNAISPLSGVYFDVTSDGTAPDGTTDVVDGDRIAVEFSGSSYNWVVVPAAALGGDLSSVAHVCYGSQVELALTQEQTLPQTLWNFDAITSTEIIDNALRGVGFAGEPQAVFIEAGVDNVNRLYADSQKYFNAFGFIAFYGSYIENSAGQYIPPSSYVAGVAARRYRAEGFQFPPAGTKYQLADAVGVQIPVNSAQQNLLNPDGCNVVRSLPGYPATAVFIWGGRTRINPAVADQRKFQFVNTRVIQNVVYGSLRSAFDNQIFTVVDGFGVVFNQIVSIGNSVLNQLYTAGALYGARPSDAFQVICDERINTSENLENGIVNVKVFDVPVPTLERIQVDLIRVSIGQMNNELISQGLE